MSKQIRARNVICHFDNSPAMTLEQIGEEKYGISGEEFLEAIRVVLGPDKYKQMINENNKRKRRNKGKKVTKNDEQNETEESNMKARITGHLIKKIVPGSSALANPLEALLTPIDNPIKVSDKEKEKAESKVEEKATGNKTTETAEVKVEKTEQTTETVKEEKTMKDIAKMTKAELNELKGVLEVQLRGKESEIDSRKAIKAIIDGEVEKLSAKVDYAEQMVSRAEEQLKEAKKQLKEAEEETFAKMSESEENQKAIEEAEEKAADYRTDLEKVEAQIQKNAVILLMVPRYQGRTTIGLKYVSTAPRKKEGVIDECVEVNADYYKSITFSYYETMKEAEKYGYGRDVNAFAEDYAFVLMVKDFIAQRKSYKVITGKKNIRINRMLDEILGEGEWNHD